MDISLKVSRPKGGTKTYQVSKPEVVLGRSKECDMQILSTDVSRRHCQFKINDDTVTVRDLGSANGTNINGKPIKANTDIPLVPETLIEIGPLKIVVSFTPPATMFDGDVTTPAVGDGTVQNETPTELELAAQRTSDEIPIVSNLVVAPKSSAGPPPPPSFEETQDEIVFPSKKDMAPVKTKVRAEPDAPAALQDIAPSSDEPLETLEPADEEGESTVLAEAVIPSPDVDPEPVPVAEAVAEADTSTEPSTEPVAAEKKSGGLKSLFGLMSRGKKKTAPEAVAAPVDQAQPDIAADQPPEAASVFETSAAPVVEVAARPNVEAIDDRDEIDEIDDELLDDLDENELEALLADEGLEDESPATETPVVNVAPPPPADPGLADFLKQIGQDG